MSETDARAVAKAYGGEAWHSGGGVWLVLKTKPDGKWVVFSDDQVCEYADEVTFRQGRASAGVVLA